MIMPEVCLFDVNMTGAGVNTERVCIARSLSECLQDFLYTDTSTKHQNEQDRNLFVL